jgi:hypothetical protein
LCALLVICGGGDLFPLSFVGFSIGERVQTGCLSELNIKALPLSVFFLNPPCRTHVFACDLLFAFNGVSVWLK